MYRYDEFDRAFVAARVCEFSNQIARRIAGEMTEEEFIPLRLRNGVYLQLHSYMLRVAIPYGTLSSRQLRKLAFIAKNYDKGYGHFTTRQNIQFNWPKLSDIPDILTELAEVDMHTIQTSGNCIRNITADPFSGAAADEFVDPRPYAEVLRQWSLLHPEFSYLPRKFKFAITGAQNDRAAIRVHDIGLQLYPNKSGRLCFDFYVGGGQGRTPMLAERLRSEVPAEYILAYATAVMRIYNLYGRRDNRYKARIKILLHETGLKKLHEEVEKEFSLLKKEDFRLSKAETDAISAYFLPPDLFFHPGAYKNLAVVRQKNKTFDRWITHNITAHKHADYALVTISLKPDGGIPGDITAAQMEVVADLATLYSQDELRVSHHQNLVLPHVALTDLLDVYERLSAAGLATANAGLIGDIIACPGLDYCSLANARSISVAQKISSRFSKPEKQTEIGEINLNISGCINACGHHHVAHIGILGVEKKGDELYQLTLGGNSGNESSIGEITGRGFAADEIVYAVETVINTYLLLRNNAQERFIETWKRVGMIPFRQALYKSQSKTVKETTPLRN